MVRQGRNRARVRCAIRCSFLVRPSATDDGPDHAGGALSSYRRVEFVAPFEQPDSSSALSATKPTQKPARASSTTRIISRHSCLTAQRITAITWRLGTALADFSLQQRRNFVDAVAPRWPAGDGTGVSASAHNVLPAHNLTIRACVADLHPHLAHQRQSSIPKLVA